PSSSIVGTWQWVRVNDQAINGPFYIRFFPDGTAATWPAPEGFSTTNGVSHGDYHYDGEFLVIETGADKDNPKSRVAISGDELTMTDDEANRYIYHRVVPDLQPGKFLPGQPSRGAPEF
ncbi:MAG: lipocalin family protein, partial [Opitutales bacterium]